MARGEILHRFSLSGVAALRAASDAERKKAQGGHEATMTLAGRRVRSRAEAGINLSSEAGGYDRGAAAGCSEINGGAGTAHGAYW
jgi:hypothetical protein